MDKKESILETLALQNRTSEVEEGRLIAGTSYMLDGTTYEVIWSGVHCAYCKTYNQFKQEEKVLIRIDKLLKGEFCPF